jgi:hypothetical protein
MYSRYSQTSEHPSLKLPNRFSAFRLSVLTGLAFVLVALNVGFSAAQSSVTVSPLFLYDLSTFTGKVPLSFARMTVDEKHKEVYVVDPANQEIRIFNDTGLQLYSFGDDERFGFLQDIVVFDSGDLLVLSSGEFILCNYRGDIKKILKLQGLPEKLKNFRPERMILRQGKIYMAQDKTMQVLIFDQQLNFLEFVDLPDLLDYTPKQVENSGLGGFNVAEDGTILFTIPTVAHAYRLPPGSDEVHEFGEGGSAPGHFGIVQGIAPGPDGLIYIADVLKSSVLVWDKNLTWITEFGGRTGRRGGLWSPVNLASTYEGCKLYVSQRAKRGISVFRICE